MNFAASYCTAGLASACSSAAEFNHDPERGAVLGRDLVEIVGGLEAAGARHVLRDQRRLSRNVLAQVARHHAAVEIGGARGAADGDRDGLAREERLGRLRGGLLASSAAAMARADPAVQKQVRMITTSYLCRPRAFA